MINNKKISYDPSRKTFYEKYVAAEYCYQHFLENTEDYKPLKLLRKYAQENNPWAIVKLAKCYLFGISYDWEEDKDKCINLLEGLPNFPLAVLTLGEILISLKCSLGKAQKLLKRATKFRNTSPDAHLILGTAYLSGDFFDKNLIKAKKHLNKAYQLGHPDAEEGLQNLRRHGEVKTNIKEVFEEYSELKIIKPKLPK